MLSLEAVTHVVQVALTPIFLLSGIAALLNVFAARLARVADRVDRLAEVGQGDALVMRRLRQRSRVLDVAVVLASLAGLSTCGAALTLFYGALHERAASDVLFALFAGALVLTMLAILMVACEMMLSGQAVREQSAK
jgi:hypothetical protein